MKRNATEPRTRTSGRRRFGSVYDEQQQGVIVSGETFRKPTKAFGRIKMLIKYLWAGV